jgi:hypothetical protein
VEQPRSAAISALISQNVMQKEKSFVTVRQLADGAFEVELVDHTRSDVPVRVKSI